MTQIHRTLVTRTEIRLAHLSQLHFQRRSGADKTSTIFATLCQQICSTASGASMAPTWCTAEAKRDTNCSNSSECSLFATPPAPRQYEVERLRCNLPAENARSGAYLAPSKVPRLAGREVTVQADERPTGVRQKTHNLKDIPNCRELYVWSSTRQALRCPL